MIVKSIARKLKHWTNQNKPLSPKGGRSDLQEKTLHQLLIIRLSVGLPLVGCFLLGLPSAAQIPSQLQEESEAQTTPQQQESIPPTPPRYLETPYTLGPEDVVSISIFNVPEYSGEYRVSVDGTLNLPIVGSVDVQGLTIPQANELISRRYTPILQRPIVTVSLAAPRPIRVAIAGEVNRPGSYNLGGEGGTFPPITQAIQQAGGITRSANVREVRLRRVFNGQPYVLNVNLWNLVEEGQIIQDVTLRDGDTIFIPAVNENNAQETRQLAQSTIAPTSQSAEIAVVGEVPRPGPYQISGGGENPPTVTQAIQAAGGITNLSDIRNIEVQRTTRTGTNKILVANLWELLQAGDVSQDVILQSGDTVVVPQAETLNPTEAEALASASFSPETISVNFLGEVARAGTVQVPSNTPLNQAILAAGGFTSRADRGEVELVRLNPNGTVTRREIEVNFNEGIDPENNPTLRNNDLILVERSALATVSDTVTNILRPVTSIVQGIQFFEIFFPDEND
jgi:polysaccharide export outer membrane protein